MSLPIEIRKAEREDCPEIFRLIKELAKSRNQLDQLKITVETLERDGFAGEYAQFHCLVAHLAGDPMALIGICTFSFIYSWGGRGIQVSDLYVSQEYQGQSIGTRLLQEVTKRASDEGCLRVNFRLLHNDKSIRKYCERKAILNVANIGKQVMLNLSV